MGGKDLSRMTGSHTAGGYALKPITVGLPRSAAAAPPRFWSTVALAVLPLAPKSVASPTSTLRV